MEEHGRIYQENLVSKRIQGSDLPEWRAIATCETNPEVIYVSYAGFRTNEDTTFVGVAKSNNEGTSWDLVWKDKVNQPGAGPSSNFESGWLNDRFGPGWGENPFCDGCGP